MEMHHNHLKDPFCERLPTVSGFKAPNLLQLIKLDMYYKYIYIYMVAPPKKNLCFLQKYCYLQCFTHILASRFWELFWGAPYV